MILPILKVLSIVSTAFFGLFASLTNFRDVNNKITLNGKIALVGVIISSILAGSVQVLNDKVVEDQSNELMAQNNAILLDVRKTLNPFNELSVDYTISYNLNDSLVRKTAEQLTNLTTPKSGSFFTKSFLIDEKSTFYRALDQKAHLKLYIGDNIFDVDDTNQQKSSVNIDSVDLKIIQVLGAKKDFSFGTDSTGTLAFCDFTTKFEVNSVHRYWLGNGNITSVYDLLNKQIVISLSNAISGNEDVNYFKDKLSLFSIRLTLQNGSFIFLDGKDLKIVSNEKGYKFYVYTLPNSIKELRLLNKEIDFTHGVFGFSINPSALY